MWEGLRTPLAESAEIVLCWDERQGVPELINPRNSLPVATGVVWATEESRRRIPFHIAKAALKCAHKIWTLSTAQLPVLKKDFGLRESQLGYLPFGVDADFFKPGDQSTDFEEDLVVSVGNDRDRDFPTLVKAAGIVNRRSPRMRLELATRQPVILPEGLGHRHNDLTHRELLRKYQHCAVVAVPTRPNLHVSGITAILEAMACAKPVVATDTPGIREYVQNHENGIIVPPGDPEKMARAISGILDDPERGRELGLRGRRVVESNFNTRGMAERLAALIS